MSAPLPEALRARFQKLIEEGLSGRAAALRLKLSPATGARWGLAIRRTGQAKPSPQGRPRGKGKLDPHRLFLIELIDQDGDMTMPELAGALADATGVQAHPDLTQEGLAQALYAEHGVRVAVSSVGYWLHRLGLKHKKTLLAAEQARPDVVRERTFWISRRQPFMKSFLPHLAFIDETSLKTNMIKKTGWAPRGQRLIDHVPFGHWNTQTFIAALRHDRLDALWVIKGAIDRIMFDKYIETQLAPTLERGDVVILDNLPSHKSAAAQEVLKAQGNWLLFLPKYSPDLNPIEMAFSKLKVLIRKAAARTYDDLWKAVGHVCNLFSDDECYHFFKVAGYEAD